MSLDTGQSSASSIDTAVSANVDSPQDSTAQAVETSADTEHVDTASGQDAIADLDRQYKENLLAPEEKEEISEPETESQPEETVAPEAEVEEVETDPLAEQTGPRTLEDLKKQFPRVQTIALEEIAKSEAREWALQEKVAKVGGDVGLGIAGEMMPLLLKADPDDQDADSALDHIFLTNASLGIGMSKLLLTKALSEEAIDPATNLPIGVATGNAIVKEFLDPNEDVESIRELIEFKKAGLLDVDELRKDLETYSGQSEREKELEARLKAVEDRDKAAQAEQQRNAQAHARERYDKALGHVSSKLMETLVPMAEHYGWTATKEELASDKLEIKELAESKVAFGEFVTAWVNNKMRQHPEWAAVNHLARSGEALSEDGLPTDRFTSNSELLINKVKADFKEMVRKMNKTFAKSFTVHSRAAQLKAKTTRSGAVRNEIPPLKKTEENGNKSDPIAKLDEEYRRATREARVSL